MPRHHTHASDAVTTYARSSNATEALPSSSDTDIQTESPTNESVPHLYAYIRRDVADTFTSAIREAYIQASSALNGLQGDV